MENKEKKKDFFAMIWESMTKTGGCCGAGETCCVPAKNDNDKTVENKKRKIP